MIDPKKYRDQLIHRRNQMIADLADFESGDFKMASRRLPATEWMDETTGMIEHYKQQIEAYDRIIGLFDLTLYEPDETNPIH